MKNKIILALLAVAFLTTTSFGNELAWMQTDSYTPPDFEAFFPDDAAGGKILDELWQSKDKDSRSDIEILGTVRNGLRNTKQHRTVKGVSPPNSLFSVEAQSLFCLTALHG